MSEGDESSSKRATPSALFEYDGEQAKVRWDRRLCIHVGECGRAKGDLFVGGRKPWCQPDLTGVEDVIDVCHRCPTGALSYERKDGGPDEAVAKENVAVIANHGPIYLRGQLKVEAATEDMPAVKHRVALCRCGQSKNKPFCDNSHETADFRDRGAIGDAGKGFEAPGGELVVKTFEDGPLMLAGNLELETAAGRRAWRGTKAFLCRCGQSQNKPFCDGAHKKTGFKAE